MTTTATKKMGKKVEGIKSEMLTSEGERILERFLDAPECPCTVEIICFDTKDNDSKQPVIKTKHDTRTEAHKYAFAAIFAALGKTPLQVIGGYDSIGIAAPGWGLAVEVFCE